MKRRILAAVLAVCLTLGTAAALPQGAFDGEIGLTVSAESAQSDFTTQTLSDGTLQIISYNGNADTVVIPSEIGGKKVTRIVSLSYDGVQYHSVNPKKVIVSEGIIYIDMYAFENCDRLEIVELPSTIRNAENSAFSRCGKLKEIKVASGCEKYCSYDGVLYTKNYDWLVHCPATKTSITIPNGVTYICGDAFLNSRITSITLPQTLQQIGVNAFKNAKIKSIHIPPKVFHISYDAFFGCDDLESITIDSGNKKYCAVNGIVYNKDKTALEIYLTKSKNLTLPDTVKIIDRQACAFTGVESVTLPDSVTDIGEWAFYKCTSLKNLKLSGNLKSIEMFAFAKCASLEKITIPGSINTVGKYMFYDCTSLASADIEYGVEKIGDYAFLGCQSLQKVRIPSSVTSIGKYALGYYDANPNGNALYKKYKDFTIYGVKGSEAEKYAKEEGFEFVDTLAPVRLAGNNRYETAAIISENIRNRSTAVILASGEGYADALAGVPLAKYLGAPILLTPKNSLSQEALVQIKNRGAKKVIILGGEGAVSKDVESALEKEGLKTVRLAGSNRYGTAVEIAKNMDYKPTEVFFACADGFADALSAGAAAALKSAPIIYLGKDGELNADTRAYLEQLRDKGCVKNAYVIGGNGVISDSMMKKAAAMLGLKSGTTVQRISGSDRYETCLAVNKQFASLFTGKTMCVSTGLNFPDALAGGVYAAENKAFMLLADKTLNANQSTFLSGKEEYSFIVFGGKGVVSDDLLTKVYKAMLVPKK